MATVINNCVIDYFGDDMSTVFVIDGGAGRVITAIPALLKFYKNNPENDFRVCIYGWDNLFWGIPELQDRTFNVENKGIFDNIFMKATKVVSPEPYRLPAYYKQEKSLAQAFDAIINKTDDHSDLPNITLPLNKAEEINATAAIGEILKEESRRNKPNVVIQPWGSTARKAGTYVIDDSSRSLEPWSYIKLVKTLSEKYNLFYFGTKEVSMEEDEYTLKFEGDLRFWSALISCSDYFIGVDSLGQHMAKAHNIPGTVILGSTFAENISYPDYFNIFEKSGPKKYSPLRINGLDSHLADRLNDTRMNFSDEELDKLISSIDKDIQKKIKKA